MDNIKEKQYTRLVHLHIVTYQESSHDCQVKQNKQCFTGDDPPVDKSAFFDDEVKCAYKVIRMDLSDLPWMIKE